MLMKRGLLFLFGMLFLFIMLPFCYAHVCNDVVSGGQVGCPDPQTVKYVSYSISGNVVTILTDITATHVQWGSCADCFPTNYNGGRCNTGSSFTSGFTVKSFTKSSAGSGDMSQITVSSSPSLSYSLSDKQTQRFSIYLTINPNAPTQQFKVRVGMVGSKSSVTRPIYDVTLNWEGDGGDPGPGGCTSNSQCNDNNACTSDICNSGTCVNNPIPNCCTSNTQCNDNNACTSDVCNSGTCTNNPISYCCTSSSQCEDNNACTTNTCSGNKCYYPPATGVACTSDNNACTNDVCSSGGTCVHNAISNCCASSSQCTSIPYGSACTLSYCISNLCSYSSKNCVNNDGCCPIGCTYLNDNDCAQCTSVSQCNDNNLCTTDTCVGGFCNNNAVSNCCTLSSQCNDNNACTTNTCSGNKCSYPAATGAPCTSDNDPSTNDICSSSGTCMHNAISGYCTSAAQCNDGDACTTDTCSGGNCMNNPITSCTNNDGCCPIGCNSLNDNNCVQCTTANQATVCDDNNTCTSDTCSSNTCLNSNLQDMTVCSGGVGRCCGGVCDTILENSEFASECRSESLCSGINWQYNIINNGAICSTGICSEGLCKQQISGGDNQSTGGNNQSTGGDGSSSGKTYYATASQLRTGSTKIYSSGDELKITLPKESHTVVVDTIGPTSVKIIVSSAPQEATLYVGETKKFSFTPGWYNLSVTLSGITGSGETAKADLKMISIKEKICEESWDCGKWEKCSEGIQKRTCTDSNNCDAPNNKPAVEQACEDSEEGGKGIIYFLIGIIILAVITLFVILMRNRNSSPNPLKGNFSPSDSNPGNK